MDARRREVAAEILAAHREHDARQADRLDRYRSLEPESAALLHLLVLTARPRRILEIGTSAGYSTIWLADAAQAVGADLRSVDTHAGRQALAAANLDRAGVTADLVLADGGTTLHESPDGFWDFVFLDSERTEYTAWWPDLTRALAPHGVLVLDNVLSHADEVAEITQLIEADQRLTTTLVPVGAGMRLAVRR